MDNKIKVAVIGVGFFGQRHAKTYFDLKECELVGVVDPNMERAKEIAQKYQCEAFSDIAKLFGRIDAASIVTHTLAHHEIAKRLLAEGIDILIEKPMTSTLEEADEINHLAHQKTHIVQVGHIERFNPAFHKLKEHVTSPRFIECHRTGPFLNRATDVSVVLDLMIHDIDLILSIVPSEIRHIDAVGTSVITNEIDIANARLSFVNGAVANITASRVSSERVRKIRIFQEEEYLSLNFLNQELVVHERIERPGEEWPSVIAEKFNFEKGEPLRDELSAFIKSVQTRFPPVVSGREARRSLAVALQIIDLIKISENLGISPDFKNGA
jgi:predicted dehydrogenase